MKTLATQENLEIAWGYIWDRLFLPDTNLFYDYLTSRDSNMRFAHLPSPQEIALDFPNPCGWSTGMEDCMLNAGSILEILCMRHELDGEDNLSRAEAVLDGICLCVSAHGQPGFLARGISPADKRSCYSNSSRDQLTLAIYGVWRFLESFQGAPESVSAKARFILRSIAERCEKTLSQENGYDFGRLDGGAALVSKLWECEPHEAMRLPMIYAAAYLASGEGRFLTLAERYAADGAKISCGMSPSAYRWDIPNAQMQLSLQFFKKTELFPGINDSIELASRQLGKFAEADFMATLAEAEAFDGEWGVLNSNWRLLPMKTAACTISKDGKNAVYGGKTYMTACFPTEFEMPNRLLRALGNNLIAAVLGGSLLTRDAWKRFLDVVSEVDFAKCGGGGPIQLLHGCCLARRFSLFS